jgi:hypothetical protein
VDLMNIVLESGGTFHHAGVDQQMDYHVCAHGD